MYSLVHLSHLTRIALVRYKVPIIRLLPQHVFQRTWIPNEEKGRHLTSVLTLKEGLAAGTPWWGPSERVKEAMDYSVRNLHITLANVS
jgi:hypothetical protein